MKVRIKSACSAPLSAASVLSELEGKETPLDAARLSSCDVEALAEPFEL